MRPDTYVALLRGINVGGRNVVPMPDLRVLCTALGWGDVRSYIQSGNLVFRAADAPGRLEDDLERAIERMFGLSIAVIVRSGASWSDYVRDNPFPEASRSQAGLVMLSLSKAPPKADAVDTLRARAANGERVDRVGDALWLHFGGGVGQSRLSPALLDRLVGSPVTLRNWRTVLKLSEMAGHPAPDS